ncbi:MAG: hypothetical protein NVS3B20_04790 [Polyangiales bacterium]
MNGLRGVGLNYRNKLLFIDHLGPVCELMDVPLIVFDQQTIDLARKYYPKLQTLLLDRAQITADYLMENFDVIFHSELFPVRGNRDEILDNPGLALLPGWDLHVALRQIQEKIESTQAGSVKKTRFVCMPRGMADKGYYDAKFAYEDIPLIFGKNVLDIFEHWGTREHLRQHVMIGSFRYQYYRKNKAHFDKVANDEFFHALPPSPRTYVYAPTWNDPQESPSSFFAACEPIVDSLPAGENLIIKLHPNIVFQAAEEANRIIGKYKGKRNVVFIPSHPLVYPFLARGDIFIGDTSSVGYDYLCFQRPMYFLNPRGWAIDDRRVYVHRCGVQIQPHDFNNVFKIIQSSLAADEERFGATRREVYKYTFHDRTFDQIRQDVERACAEPVPAS